MENYLVLWRLDLLCLRLLCLEILARLFFLRLPINNNLLYIFLLEILRTQNLILSVSISNYIIQFHRRKLVTAQKRQEKPQACSGTLCRVVTKY
jgi:hypothetical protein